MPGPHGTRLALLALTRAVLAYAALSVVSLAALWLARSASPVPSPYFCAVVGPTAWLVWGVGASLPFAVGSLGVVFMLTVAFFVWLLTGWRLALATGVAAALIFWLASGWLAWVVTR